jgi:hypothetical protein
MNHVIFMEWIEIRRELDNKRKSGRMEVMGARILKEVIPGRKLAAPSQ